MTKLELTDTQIIVILSALSACNKSGGGSEVNTCMVDIVNQTLEDVDHARVMAYQSAIVSAWAEFVGLDLSAVGSNVGNYIHKAAVQS